VRELSDRYARVDPDPHRGDHGRPAAAVEILKALYRSADILVGRADAVLRRRRRRAFEIVRGLVRGKSIIFISHKLNEVLEIADRITGACGAAS
jgi:simple sugar transport system ATP-binding protein